MRFAPSPARSSPQGLAEFAYADTPLPIGENQTISQPYIVALTIEALALRGNERVLEVGTGSGYAAAILGTMAKEIFAVERLEPLATTARERLARLGYDNVLDFVAIEADWRTPRGSMTMC